MDFIDHSQDTTELAKALLLVQRHMSPATRDGKNPFTKSSYATLNSVMEACRDALLDNHIWLCQYPVPVDMPECIGLMTKLTHTESGQWQASLAVVPLPKADPQGMGSAITYARRYAITAMLGMVTEDDDGESAKLPQKSVNKPKPSPLRRPCATQPHGTNTDCAVDAQTQTEASLPQIEGVTYQIVAAQDGRNCIVAMGNTQPQKDILKEAGFLWNPQRKFWWKYAEAV